MAERHLMWWRFFSWEGDMHPFRLGHSLVLRTVGDHRLHHK